MKQFCGMLKNVHENMPSSIVDLIHVLCSEVTDNVGEYLQ